uniref:Ig-like domain-containing protein n=1 Tax=Gopherus evgoodei TaxID=1825980 RepID=A0A8C4YSD8_9SAUR
MLRVYHLTNHQIWGGEGISPWVALAETLGGFCFLFSMEHGHLQVSVSRRDTPDGSVTLSCCARGFYPRPIHVSWVRDGEDILAEKDSSGILSNADSTYYMQSSLEISPQQEDRHRYACRVEHSSLGEPTLVWGKGG